MKNLYLLTGMARPEGGLAWTAYKETMTTKAAAKKAYDALRTKSYVQGIILKNLTTGEVLQAEITENRYCGTKRTKRIILK